jgi:hypothetical protein
MGVGFYGSFPAHGSAAVGLVFNVNQMDRPALAGIFSSAAIVMLAFSPDRVS